MAFLAQMCYNTARTRKLLPAPSSDRKSRRNRISPETRGYVNYHQFSSKQPLHYSLSDRKEGFADRGDQPFTQHAASELMKGWSFLCQ